MDKLQILTPIKVFEMAQAWNSSGVFKTKFLESLWSSEFACFLFQMVLVS